MKHLREAKIDRLLELLVRACRRVSVRTPPPEPGRVSEPVSLHVVVRHFDDQFGAKRDEGEVFALAPPALSARHPVFRRSSSSAWLHPRIVVRAGLQVLQFLDQRRPPRCRELSGDANMLESPAVVQSEQE